MNENKKSMGKKKRFLGVLNLLDLLLLMFVVAIMVALFFKGDIIGKLKSSTSESQIEFQIRTDGVRLVTCLAIEEGHNVYDKENGAYLGKVINVSYKQYMREVTMPDGVTLMAPDPEYYTLYVTVQGSGSSTPEGLFMNGTRLVSPGGSLAYKTELVSTNGIVSYSNEVGRN